MARGSWLLMYVGVALLGCGDRRAGGADDRRDAAVESDAAPEVAIDAAPGAMIDAMIDAGPVSTDAGDPALLSMQGVYGDFARRTLPVDAIAYDVQWPLWADGATKRRWLILAPGSAPIDNTDQDHWRLPAGARLVKEFTRDGVLVETRIVERTGAGAADYSLRTYVWNAAQREATLDLDGATDVNGTGHDVPTAEDCKTCHDGEPGKALGFSAVQLPRATLAMLSSTGRLAKPIAADTPIGPTGTAEAVDALGYLHGNCGHCHNPGGFAGRFNNQTLRLDTAGKPAEHEPGWVTTVGVAVQGSGAGATRRIDPLHPENSAIVVRMSLRGANQMPLIATKLVDPTGVGSLTTWVNSLAP